MSIGKFNYLLTVMLMLGLLVLGLMAFFALYALPNYYREKLTLCGPITERSLDLDDLLRENNNNSLKERVLHGDTTAYSEVYYDMSVCLYGEHEIGYNLAYSIIMANKFDDPEANFYVFKDLIEFEGGSIKDSVNVDSVDMETLQLSLRFLCQSASLGYTPAIELQQEINNKLKIK